MAEKAPKDVIDHINRSWQEHRFEEIRESIHPSVFVSFPGFAGGARGGDEFVRGFRDFASNARVSEFSISDVQEEIIGATAMVTYLASFDYERDGNRYMGTARDLWILAMEDEDWTVVYRAILDLSEEVVE